MAQNLTRSLSVKVFVCLCVFGSVYVLLLASENGHAAEKRSSAAAKDGRAEKGAAKPFVLDTFALQGSSNSKFTTVTSDQDDDDDDDATIDVVIIFTRAYENRSLKRKFWTCITSLFANTVSSLKLHIITDEYSLPSAKKIFDKAAHLVRGNSVQVSLYNVEAVVQPIEDIVHYMQPHFSYKPGAYYSDSLFFLSIAIYKVFHQEQLIMVDADTKFLADIKDLHAHFKNFNKHTVMGIAWEQQPVYRHLLHEYRTNRTTTRAGGPPPNGLPGFNSGVLLLNLKQMQSSSLYQQCINSSTVEELTRKYRFKGHLGDQDFFSLISFEHEELFYVLPCGWNRQLCQWWKDHGYEDVFYDYYNCTDTVKVYHGNCNSNIPQ